MPSGDYSRIKRPEEFTPEERAENGRKGGIASGVAKRKKKAMRETLEVLLSMPLNNKKCYDVEEIETFAKLKGKNVDVNTAILIKQVQRALSGDLPAAEFVRDTSGQAPSKDVNIEGTLPVTIIEDLD